MVGHDQSPPIGFKAYSFLKNALNWMIASCLPEASTNSVADQNWGLTWEDTLPRACIEHADTSYLVAVFWVKLWVFASLINPFTPTPRSATQR
jgi:hypothetical protein